LVHRDDWANSTWSFWGTACFSPLRFGQGITLQYSLYCCIMSGIYGKTITFFSKEGSGRQPLKRSPPPLIAGGFITGVYWRTASFPLRVLSPTNVHSMSSAQNDKNPSLLPEGDRRVCLF
jgi:hypothetical protein